MEDRLTPSWLSSTEVLKEDLSEEELEEILGPFPSPIEELGAPSATPPDEAERTEEEL